MEKAVLISTAPKMCELIASGEKTIEIRKNRPQIETPFKVYIYQTKKKWIYRLLKKLGLYQGTVMGEFICDRIDSYIKEENNRYWWNFCSPDEIEEIKGKTCLTLEELVDYTGDSKTLYGWHVSDLVIYDKPRGIWEFARPCDGCNKLGTSRCVEESSPCRATILKRPPQSWCYVKENGIYGNL